LSSREEIYVRLTEIALKDFHDIISGCETVDGKLRLMLTLPRMKFVGFSSLSRRLYGSHSARVLGNANVPPVSWTRSP